MFKKHWGYFCINKLYFYTNKLVNIVNYSSISVCFINFAFKRLKLRRLEAGVFAENPSSGKLLEKYGFKKEGMKRRRRNGIFRNTFIYELNLYMSKLICYI